ncbi:MAG: hypothetical protein U9R46_04515 [Bacteroidota bacterium]|nr:hypothetical protein [Bacteroidota bacterium]
MSLYEKIKPHTDKLNELSTERVDKFYSFVKTVLSISGGMVAILVSLKSKQEDDNSVKLLFTITIGLLSAGIAFGSILLYTEVTSLRHLEKSLSKYISEHLEGSKEDYWLDSGNPGKWFSISKWGMIVCFLLSLGCLTAYSYF